MAKKFNIRKSAPKRGQQIKIKELARMAQTIERHDRTIIHTGLEAGIQHDQGPAGTTWRNNAYIPFWAEITAKDGGAPQKFSFTENVDTTTDGTMIAKPSGPRTGSDASTSYPAYEVNGSDVPIGVIVLMWLGSSGDHYLFWYPGPAEIPCLKFESPTSLLICGNGKSEVDLCTIFREESSLLICDDGKSAVDLCVVFEDATEMKTCVSFTPVDSATIDFTYEDGKRTITASVIDDSITYAKMQNVSAAERLLGRGTDPGGSGDTQEILAYYPLYFFDSGGINYLAIVGTTYYKQTLISGTTTDAYVHVTGSPFTLSNGGVVKLSIKNTHGSNSLDWKITATDPWSSTEAYTRTVTFGAKSNYHYDSTEHTTIGRPFTAISIEVISTSAGNAATYELYVVLDA